MSQGGLNCIKTHKEDSSWKWVFARPGPHGTNSKSFCSVLVELQLLRKTYSIPTQICNLYLLKIQKYYQNNTGVISSFCYFSPKSGTGSCKFVSRCNTCTRKTSSTEMSRPKIFSSGPTNFSSWETSEFRKHLGLLLSNKSGAILSFTKLHSVKSSECILRSFKCVPGRMFNFRLYF